MDDLDVLSIRQIAQYPLIRSVGPSDVTLLQQNGLGGPYKSIQPVDLVSTALQFGGDLNLVAGSNLNWNGATLTFNGGMFDFSAPLTVPALSVAGSLLVQGEALAFEADLISAVEQIVTHSVASFNGRIGRVLLETSDILQAGAAPIWNAHFGGHITAPTVWNPQQADDTVATTLFVQQAICSWYNTGRQLGTIVSSFNGRGGDVVLTADDITAAATAPGVYPQSNTPPSGDYSKRIATTQFVGDAIDDSQQMLIDEITSSINLSAYAPLDSPQFTGVPTAPTANPGTTTGQLATTAFVQHAVTASTTGVASFNTRTGAVVLTTGDVTGVGGALLASPVFTGLPQAPTAAPGTSNQQLATTAFVAAAIAALPTAGVTSFNTRTGAVTLTTADITGAGGAPLLSPALTGTPTAPTVALADSSTTLATTAFVHAAITALGTPVTSFNGRTGAVSLQASDVSAVGGAMVNSPTFTGTPAGPTPAPGNSSTQLATTAFVAAAIAAGAAGVTSFNGRSGVVTLTAADVTGVGGALLASPAFTGAPTAPSAAQASNDGTLATTAFVHAAIAAVAAGVTSFNTRSGAVTLQAADVSAVGGALIASPSFTGVPLAPTAAPGTNTTQIASTAFVAAAIAAIATGVTTFNGRAGAVTLTTADITGAGGAPLASPTFTGTPAVPTATAGTNTTQAASTAFVAAAVAAVSAGAVNYSVATFFTPGATSYTTPANSTTSTVYKIRMVAGGGGGGGVGSGTTNWTGSSGGAGEYKEFIQTGIAPNTAWPITIGAAGTAGTAAGTTGGNGGAGGATSITIAGQAVGCNGGAGGSNGGAATGGGGAGGSGGATPAITGLTLILDLPGCPGSTGSNVATPTPAGGGTPLGNGGRTAAFTSSAYNPPVAANGFGAGGGAGAVLSQVGSAGAVGAVIIERIAG